MTLSYDNPFEVWYEIDKDGRVNLNGEPDGDGVVMRQEDARKFTASLQSFLTSCPELERLKSFSKSRLVKIKIEDK